MERQRRGGGASRCTLSTCCPATPSTSQTASLRAPPQRPGALSAVALERVGVTAIATRCAGDAASPPAARRRRGSPSRRGASWSAPWPAALPEPEATLLLGIAFGVHGTLARAVRTPLQDAGLIHIVAVSGLKVVMVAGLVSALARLRRLVAAPPYRGDPGRHRAYVVLSGAGAAARAQQPDGGRRPAPQP